MLTITVPGRTVGAEPRAPQEVGEGRWVPLDHEPVLEPAFESCGERVAIFSAAWDPVRRQVIVFDDRSTRVFAMAPGGTWSVVPTDGATSFVGDHLTFDAATGRLVGTYCGEPVCGVRWLDLEAGTWLHEPTGTNRSQGVPAPDSAGGRPFFVMQHDLEDVRVSSAGRWVALGKPIPPKTKKDLEWKWPPDCPADPEPRVQAAAYDPRRGLLYAVRNGLWVTPIGDHLAWRPASPPLPQVRSAAITLTERGVRVHAIADLAGCRRIFMLAPDEPETWRDVTPLELPASACTERSLPSEQAVPVYDPEGDVLYLLGGPGGRVPSVLSLAGTAGGWCAPLEILHYSTEVPPDNAPTWDEVAGEIVFFGEVQAEDGGGLGVWVREPSDGSPYRRLSTAGAPRDLYLDAVVRDVRRDRWIVMGTECTDGEQNGSWRVYAFRRRPTVGWEEIVYEGAAGDLQVPSAAHDPKRERLYITLGPGEDGRVPIYALELAGVPRWTRLALEGGPRTISNGVLAYDAELDRLLLTDAYHTERPSWGEDQRTPEELWAVHLDEVPPRWRQLPVDTRTDHTLCAYRASPPALIEVSWGHEGRDLVENELWILEAPLARPAPRWRKYGISGERPDYLGVLITAGSEIFQYGGAGDLWVLELEPDQ